MAGIRGNIRCHRVYGFSHNVLCIICIGLFVGAALNSAIVSADDNIPRRTQRVPLLNRDPCQEPKLYYCTELTNVNVGRYAFKIPYNLIKAFPVDNEFMELMPEWPTMEGLVKNDKGEIFDVIRIIVNTLRPAKPTEEGISYYIKRDGLYPTSLSELGLLEYRQPKLNNAPLAYVPIDQANLLPNKQPLFIQRSPRPVGEFSHAKPDPAKGGIEGTYICSFGYAFREGVYVSVEFYNRHIKDWKEITLAVRNLVESSIQE